MVGKLEFGCMADPHQPRILELSRMWRASPREIARELFRNKRLADYLGWSKSSLYAVNLAIDHPSLRHTFGGRGKLEERLAEARPYYNQLMANYHMFLKDNPPVECPVCKTAKHPRQIEDPEDWLVWYPQHPQICQRCIEISQWDRNREDPLSAQNLDRLRRVAEILGDSFILGDSAEFGSVRVQRRALGLDTAVELIRLEKKLPWYQTMRQACGSYEEGFGGTAWFKLMVLAGVYPKGTKRTNYGIRVLAKDGHVCHSLGEKRIDDLLSEYAIEHQREPRYPTSRMRADWLVLGPRGPFYVEYFGLTGNADYDAKTVLKLSLADATGIQLVAFFPGDLPRLASAFRAKVLALIENE